MTLVRKAAFDVLTATEWNDMVDAILQPIAIVRRAAAQVIASGGGGANINFDTEDADTDTMFAPTSDTITIKTAGKYRAVLFASLAGSGQFYQITHGATVRASQTGGATANLTTPDFQASVNDTVRVGVFQSSGSNQNCTGTLSVIRVRE
jgi:hypothetical protein